MRLRRIGELIVMCVAYGASQFQRLVISDAMQSLGRNVGLCGRRITAEPTGLDHALRRA